MKLQNFRISVRLTAAFGLLTAMLLAIVAIAVVQMATMRAATHEITSNWLPSVESVNRLGAAVTAFRVRELRHVMTTVPQAMVVVEKELAARQAAFDTEHQIYIKLISSDEENRLHDEFAAGWKQYLQVHEQLIKLLRDGEADRARELLDGESQRLFEKAGVALDKLIALNHQGAVDAAADSDRAYQVALKTMGGAALIAALLALLGSRWMVRSITLPLNNAVSAADRVAGGDLSVAVPDGAKDELGQLLGALQRMQQSLLGTVRNVRSNAESVATASVQIAQGNTDLSQRTEVQASALQQTAATMDELSATVRSTADNARQAKLLAVGASGVAGRGGEVVGRVVGTMKGINESSKRIADIIGVIDGIAFQTNILALNAAVEAARAGEQGRGFAVVASEVRSLAQRSAEAAREIKTLIHDSVEQVEQGSVLVDEAGRTMHEIVDAIQRVSDIVAEISAASVEQSSGVTQVGHAITQMDQATQQNAALVEESAAAAESLRQQAQELVGAVEVFRLAAA